MSAVDRVIAALRAGNFHPSEYDGSEPLTDEWYRKVATRAVEAAVDPPPARGVREAERGEAFRREWASGFPVQAGLPGPLPVLVCNGAELRPADLLRTPPLDRTWMRDEFSADLMTAVGVALFPYAPDGTPTERLADAVEAVVQVLGGIRWPTESEQAAASEGGDER